MSRDHEELLDLNAVMTKMRNDSLEALANSDDLKIEYHKGIYDTTIVVLQKIDEYLFNDHDELFNFILGGSE